MGVGHLLDFLSTLQPLEGSSMGLRWGSFPLAGGCPVPNPGGSWKCLGVCPHRGAVLPSPGLLPPGPMPSFCLGWEPK